MKIIELIEIGLGIISMAQFQGFLNTIELIKKMQDKSGYTDSVPKEQR